MQNIRYILAVLAIVLSSGIAGQTMVEEPQMQWKSTAAMAGSGTTLPMAADQGVVTTLDGNSSNFSRPSGPRRVTPGSNSGDPGTAEETPLGNALLPLLLLAIAYAAAKRVRLRKKSIAAIAFTIMAIGAHGEGYETLANLTGTAGITAETTFTGDNGMTWKAVGGIDDSQTIGGYKALAIKATVNGNGLTGKLTSAQQTQGVGTIRFNVICLQPGTGYGNRTFRVTAGSKSTDVVANIPKINVAHTIEAQLDAVGASQISISAVPSTADETIQFYLYNITWTSFDGKTYPATFSTEAEYVADGADTIYYTEDNITLRFASAMEHATFYYTIDGSTPTMDSNSATNIPLGIGTHTIKVIAWTAEFGISDISTKVVTIAKGSIHILNGAKTDLEGKFGVVSTGMNGYTSKTGLPFYSVNKSKNNIISEVAVNPIGFSLYAYALNSKNITVSYQKGTYIHEGTEVIWRTDDTWTDITTLTNPSEAPLTRYEIALPAEARNNAVKLRVQSSGNTVYVDDITTIDQSSNQATLPTLSHPSGELASGTEVTLTPAAGTTMHYIINNAAEKTSTSAVVLTLTEATAIEAYATQEGKAQSWITRAQYTIGGVAPEPVHPTGIELSNTELSIVEGQRETLTATVLPANAENKSVTWNSSNPDVATVSEGVIIALVPGKATITATTVDGGLSATCEVTVTKYIAPEPIHPSGVTLSRTSITIMEGTIAKLTATVLPANAENKNVIWSSSDESIATVADGTITGQKPGEATITVTTVDGGLTATCAVTVTKAPVLVTGVTLNKTELTLTEGENEQLIATVTPTNADNKAVSWESSATEIASVDEDGNVTAITAGEAVITVTTAEFGFTAQCYIVVTKHEPTGIDDIKDGTHVGKILRNGQVLIIRNGETYTITGAKVQQ